MNIYNEIRKIEEKENKLTKIRSESSLMEDYGKVRSETSHTLFLASLFKKMGDYGVKELLKVIIKWDKGNLVDKNIKDNLARATFPEIMVTPEFGIHTENYGRGSIDIVIQSTMLYSLETKRINIIIENKVDASETVKGNDGKEKSFDQCKSTNNLRYQTDAYHDYFTNEDKYKDDVNIFVYLKAIGTWEMRDIIPGDVKSGACHNSKYIVLNYQELYNNVINPYYQLNKDSKIKDYIRALSLPIENKNLKTPIMARSEEEQKILKELLTKHSQLFAEAMEVMASSEDVGEELREAYTTIVKSLQTIKNRGTLYVVKDSTNQIIHEGTMWQIVKEFAIELLNLGKTVVDVNKEIQCMRSMSAKPTGVRCFSENIADFNKYTSGKYRAAEFEYNNSKYYLTDQWGASGSNVTFCTFVEKVNKKYADFQIQKK